MQKHHEDGCRKHASRVTACIVMLTCAITVVPARADDWQLGGHIKYWYSLSDYADNDVQALYGDNPANLNQLDLRLMAAKRQGAWDFTIHYELLAESGEVLATRRALAATGLIYPRGVTGLPNDATRLFDLTRVITDEPSAAAEQRIDRLSVGYGTETWLIRFGRQAVSWGNGLAFQTLDFMNPFSPVTIDKDYKTGDDLLYGQWQTTGQADTPGKLDVQAMLVPRRDPVTHAITNEDSSAGVKLRTHAAGFDMDLIAARNYGENLFGVGLAHSIGGAVWRMDISYTDLALTSGANGWSLVTNLDYSWTLFDHNMYGFAEYFHSGVGEDSEAGYLHPNPALTERLARGELFTLARDYAALGLQWEATPLVNLFANLIQNLDDGSRILQLRGVYDWRQNLQFMAGLNLPAGSYGSEYGGIPTPLPGAVLGPGRSIYLRAAYYF
jgi:hypothetical protein